MGWGSTAASSDDEGLSGARIEDASSDASVLIIEKHLGHITSG